MISQETLFKRAVSNNIDQLFISWTGKNLNDLEETKIKYEEFKDLFEEHLKILENKIKFDNPKFKDDLKSKHLEISTTLDDINEVLLDVYFLEREILVEEYKELNKNSKIPLSIY